jgi:hypothetical protein
LAGQRFASEDGQDALYRLVFIGGLFDGHEAYWDVLPEPCVKLYSAEAAGRAAKNGTAPRGALYESASSRLCSHGPAPFVVLRYTYRETRELPSRSAWNRCLLWIGISPQVAATQSRSSSRPPLAATADAGWPSAW